MNHLIPVICLMLATAASVYYAGIRLAFSQIKFGTGKEMVYDDLIIENIALNSEIRDGYREYTHGL